MCAVSMIADHYRDKWQQQSWYPQQGTGLGGLYQALAISRHEFDALKREVEDLKALLQRAKEYDAKNGEPDCEMADKVAILRAVAKLVGVDLGNVVQ